MTGTGKLKLGASFPPKCVSSQSHFKKCLDEGSDALGEILSSVLLTVESPSPELRLSFPTFVVWVQNLSVPFQVSKREV